MAAGHGVLGWRRRVGILACCVTYAATLCMFPLSGRVSYSQLADWRPMIGEAVVFIVAFAVIFMVAQVWPARSRLHGSMLLLAAAVGAVAGCMLKVGWRGFWSAWHTDPVAAWTQPIAYLGVAWLCAAMWMWQQREAALRDTLHAEQVRRTDVERQVAEAQMQALQAQVEPHFLFNTLAHLRRMYMTEPLAARSLLRDLRLYLSALQPVLGRTTIPLLEDAGYARAYLELQRTRMGSRLRYQLTLAPDTLAAQVPPLAVTTLVENAVKHGLAAAPDGGTITITSRCCDGLVQIEVADDGIGLKIGHGTGVGLANLQARLQAAHGPRGLLMLRQRPHGGVAVLLTVPEPREAGGAREQA